VKPLKRFFAPGSAPPKKKYWDVWLWPMAGVTGIIALVLGLRAREFDEYFTMLPFAFVALLAGIGGLVSSSQRFFRM